MTSPSEPTTFAKRRKTIEEIYIVKTLTLADFPITVLLLTTTPQIFTAAQAGFGLLFSSPHADPMIN